MIRPHDALWTTASIPEGKIDTATLVAVQNVRWTIELRDVYLTGYFC